MSKYVHITVIGERQDRGAAMHVNGYVVVSA